MKNYEKDGCLTSDDLILPSRKQLENGVALLECVQKIPCNPCVDVCPVDAISMKSIIDLPVIDFDTCIGCGSCISVCPGLAIFRVKVKDGTAWITLPYEFLPIPKAGDTVNGVIPIVGIADFDPAVVEFYKIELGIPDGSDIQWLTLGETHNQPVVNGMLEMLHADALPPGDYFLRLIVVQDSNYVGEPHTIPITIGDA